MIVVNGREVESGAAVVEELIVELGLDGKRRGVAVALNGVVVPRNRWAGQELTAGDRVEIVGAVQGG